MSAWQVQRLAPFLALFCALLLMPLAGLAGSSGAEKIRLTVIGDSLADGVWAGLYRNLRSVKHIKVRRASKVSSGLAAYDWHSEAERLLEDDTDIIVVMLGTNDGQAIRRAGQTRVAYRANGWRDVYAEKVDELLTLFEDRQVFTVWLGLPVMRKDSMREQAERLNKIFAEVLEGRGADVNFLPTWDLTTDDNGEYSAYADLDNSGRTRQFRAKDGVHFTMMGYQYLARHVQEVIEHQYLARRKAATQAESAPVGDLDPFSAQN
ncbi:MAG: hypothetical protein CMQ61_03545 [Gammaproteobacteria bacterium]|nr:hypothetical protein [Gammaproteobacteria bacterium]